MLCGNFQFHFVLENRSKRVAEMLDRSKVCFVSNNTPQQRRIKMTSDPKGDVNVSNAMAWDSGELNCNYFNYPKQAQVFLTIKSHVDVKNCRSV